jgi:hypothetical protein
MWGKDTTLYKIVTSPKPIKSLSNKNGRILVVRYDGVFEFDGDNFFKTNIKEEEISHTQSTHENWAKLVHPKLDYAQVELSNEGIYWVLIKNRFIYGFKTSDKIKKIFSNQAIRGIYAWRDSFLVSTYNGFYLNEKPVFPSLLIFSNGNIIAEKDYFYFVANAEMIFKMKKDGTEIEKIIHRSRLERINNVTVIRFYKGLLFLGGEKGLAVLKQNKTIQILQEDINIHNMNIIKDKLWISADDGVFILENNSLKKVFNVVNSTGVFEMDDRIVSTSFEGLWEYNPQNNRLKNILSGTPYEKIETDAFYKDNYGNFWISTINGIIRYYGDVKNISIFLEGTEFNRRSYFFKGDTIFLGSNGNGLIRFDIKELIAEDRIHVSSKDNINFFYLATIVLMTGLSGLLFIKIKLPPVNTDPDKLKEEEKFSDNEFFLSLEKYIFDHLDEVNIAEIRHRAKMSKYTFYNKFMKHFGKRPKEYLCEMKTKALQQRQNELLRKKNLVDDK